MSHPGPWHRLPKQPMASIAKRMPAYNLQIEVNKQNNAGRDGDVHGSTDKSAQGAKDDRERTRHAQPAQSGEYLASLLSQQFLLSLTNCSVASSQITVCLEICLVTPLNITSSNNRNPGLHMATACPTNHILPGPTFRAA